MGGKARPGTGLRDKRIPPAALLAAYLPARRASRVGSVVALRADCVRAAQAPPARVGAIDALDPRDASSTRVVWFPI